MLTASATDPAGPCASPSCGLAGDLGLRYRAHRRFVAAEIDDEDPVGDAQTSWRSLLRILAFARPNAGMALLGCGLSLAGTVAALVPPT